MKKYFIFRGRKNKDLEKTCKRLEKIFGKGYFFHKKYPYVNSMTRKEIRDKFTKDMKKGKFSIVIIDVTKGKGRFMKEEARLAKKLKIPVMEVNFIEK